MNEGFSNVQIDEAFESTDDGDINDNFIGAFPSNHTNKFIDHKLMSSAKKGNVRLP